MKWKLAFFQGGQPEAGQKHSQDEKLSHYQM